jgi:hypothetical protein
MAGAAEPPRRKSQAQRRGNCHGRARGGAGEVPARLTATGLTGKGAVPYWPSEATYVRTSCRCSSVSGDRRSSSMRVSNARCTRSSASSAESLR